MKKHLFFKAIRKLKKNGQKTYTEKAVMFRDQEANDYISKRIETALNNNYGLMISKFGTIELGCINCCLNQNSGFVSNFKNTTDGLYELYMDDALDGLCNNAGFFPNDINLVDKYVNMTLEDARNIDILGSYLGGEKYIRKYLPFNCVNVNLNGYYAPFLWEKPWSRLLKDKKVLVIHPFIESIENQYRKNREKLFDNPEVLPAFGRLYTIKAVQSIAGEETDFPTWFDALNHMKNEIDKIEDFDIALIGCGAYGMNLAAYVKKKGKVAIHLAGWTQMLFGIYGKRWIEDQPDFKKIINDNWITPNANERPRNASVVEGGCYW